MFLDEMRISAPRITCVVDGDTVWFEGVKYRLAVIDTPEKGALAECIIAGRLTNQSWGSPM